VHGKVYIRIEDKSFKASREMWEILKYRIKNKGARFHYGDKERVLLQYLETHKYITVDEFAALAQIPRPKASRTLVVLVVAEVLRIQPQESGHDFFAFNEQHEEK
jgi:Fic family protein